MSHLLERLERIDFVEKFLFTALFFLHDIVIDVNQVKVGHVDPFISALIRKVILIQVSRLPYHWLYQVLLRLFRLHPIISIMISRVLDGRI